MNDLPAERPDLFPNGRHVPFMELSGIVALTAGAEATLIDVVTAPYWLRLMSYCLNLDAWPPSRLRFDYPGARDLSECSAVCYQDTTNEDLPIAEWPIYAVVPPLSRLRVTCVPGSSFANGWFKLTGWYYGRERS